MAECNAGPLSELDRPKRDDIAYRSTELSSSGDSLPSVTRSAAASSGMSVRFFLRKTRVAPWSVDCARASAMSSGVSDWDGGVNERRLDPSSADSITALTGESKQQESVTTCHTTIYTATIYSTAKTTWTPRNYDTRRAWRATTPRAGTVHLRALNSPSCPVPQRALKSWDDPPDPSRRHQPAKCCPRRTFRARSWEGPPKPSCAPRPALHPHQPSAHCCVNSTTYHTS